MSTDLTERLKIYVVCHNDVTIPATDVLTPFRADRMDGLNIADREDYCELRAHYWIWKNMPPNESDYVGFFQYRRYLDLVADHMRFSFSNPRRIVPYRIEWQPKPADFTFRSLWNTVKAFDVLAPVKEYTGIPVLDRYGKGHGHRRSDLAQVLDIVRERHPRFSQAATRYLSGRGEYYGNIFLMRKSIFDNYCAWLFDILEEFDKRVKNCPEKADGYLGERLFGVYYTWLQNETDYACAEFPRLHYACYDDDRHRFSRDRMVCKLFPPGSARRAVIVRALKSLGGY